MGKGFLDAVQDRRTIYAIGNDEIVDRERIREVVRHAITYAPTAFNSQSARVILLFGSAHNRLWSFTKEVLKGIVPQEAFAATGKKIDSFNAGYGTLLYFENQSAVRDLQQQYPAYRENFPLWSLQASGMLQYIIWAALEAEGLGVSLQHYNPLIDNHVKAEWNVPEDWTLLGEMPFGKPLAPADAKSYLPMEERFKVFE